MPHTFTTVPTEYAEGIRGVVWDSAADAPAVQAIVHLQLAGRELAETRTDQDGVFTFERGRTLDLAVGTYRITIEISGRRIDRSFTIATHEPVMLVGRIEV